MKPFVEELRWRGMLSEMMPGTEEYLNRGMASGYIGFDPSADSLGVGNLVQIMTLLHFQRCGHRPVALMGGATGMIGDPSGKSAERNLLGRETLQQNLQKQQKQLEQFLDFHCGENSALIVNNLDWIEKYPFLDFLRDVGKHITISYMLAKDSVQTRLERGISFTEFSYQLIQGYDFYYLWKNHGICLQMGGSDQWGNITTGNELIRRMGGGEAYALCTPLIKKSDGTKFGKTAGGNIWLDPEKTSPYAFYQFWLNTADADAEQYLKIFSLHERHSIENQITLHRNDPGARTLQKALASEITERVHGKQELDNAIKASGILFGKSVKADFEQLGIKLLRDVFDGLPSFSIPKAVLVAGIPFSQLLTEATQVLPSRSEFRRAMQEGSLSLNKSKVDDPEHRVTQADLLCDTYLLVQRGKKNYYLLIAG